jgi:GGDEF domain-containing protein
MSELPDQPTPARRRAPRKLRRTRFEMPVELHDERVGEVIEAFLDGPPERPRRVARTRARRDKLRSIRKPAAMDTRHDWETALRHEDARLARYGRPAGILVVRLHPWIPGSVDRLAARVGALIREHARETDRVTRAAPDRFHVLLPETGEAEAAILGERIRDACADLLVAKNGHVLQVLTAAVSPGSSETLHDALRMAQEAVAG